MQDLETEFVKSNTIVLQILPDLINEEYQMVIDGVYAKRTPSVVYMPKENPKYHIHCQLDFFQKNVSIPNKQITLENGKKETVPLLGELVKAIVTTKSGSVEKEIILPKTITSRLFEYLCLDVFNNKSTYKGFDCYALVCLLSDVAYYPPAPYFEYLEAVPKVGDVVVLTDGGALPDSIKHWTLFLGDDTYLSKFGVTGYGSDSLLDIMDLDGMKHLYNSNTVYVARPKKNANSWGGFPKG